MEAKLRSKSLEQIITEEGEGEPLFAEIRRRQLALEVPLIHLTLKSLAEGRLRLRDKMVYWENELKIDGVDLTEDVEMFLSGRI